MNQIAKRISDEENWGHWSGVGLLDWQRSCPNITDAAYKLKMGTVTNRVFQVNVFMARDEGRWGRMVEAAIRRHDGKPISWEDLQRIKNELFGPENEAVELFPAESRKVNMKNNDQRRLWVKIQAGFTFPIGADRQLTEKQRQNELEFKRNRRSKRKAVMKARSKAKALPRPKTAAAEELDEILRETNTPKSKGKRCKKKK